ncbi:hypothetical protein P4S72_19305 [Vibrio sp. PP-XX7]
MMIIDCHGHYTTTPAGVGEYRDKQKQAVARDPLFQGSAVNSRFQTMKSGIQ